MQGSEAAKISVITCFFNVEEFIEETIQSVLSQQYDNWELLLIDDGSKDGSSKIANEYANKYPGKIKYHEHKAHQNKGLSYSRNVGIEMASGEFITFLDADDIWLPQYLPNQVEIFRQHPACAMICEATEYWYNWNNAEYGNTVIAIGASQDTVYSAPQLMLTLYPLGDGAAPCMCGVIIKKNVLEKYGGFDDSFKGMYEDQVFLSKIYLNENIFISSACNNRYRQRPDSLIGKSFDNGNYYNVRKRFLVWLKKYISDNNIAYRDVQEKLENALSFEPLITVIICFYNEKLFLQEAIESVLKQSYKCWELLLIDDGSADESSNIALRYAHKYPGKISYHQHDEHRNKGLSASRNHGIKNSAGEFIAFLDADDVWLENKLITQVSIFQRNPQVGMAAEASLYWYEWAKKMRHNIEVPIGADPELIYEPSDLILSLYPLGKGAAPVPSGLMIKKEALERSGMFEESFAREYALYEDQAFLSKMYL
ncbi:MAG: glycosyltransferase family 2 protein, partial [Bacteroidota bacterium]|nr:glycosyltransferase family 2 protein [Bacteroidota bacterium]